MVVVSESTLAKLATSPRFYNSSTSKRIFSDVAGDITITVDGKSFLLHKYPLVSRSGKICKMVVASQDPDLSKLELLNVPGGAKAFELAAKFCYGTNFEINTGNVAHLRCVAEYLEMTEDYGEENLIARTETYVNDIVVQSLEKSVEVLCSYEGLYPMVEEVGIVNKCVDAIAINASKEQLVSGLARLECGSGSGKLKLDCQDWWLDDLSVLKIDLYQRVIAAMRRTGVRPESITSSVIHYTQNSLKDIEKRQAWISSVVVGDEQRIIVETLVGLLATEKISSVPLPFLFAMLRMAIAVAASIDCRLELERRIGFQLELVSLDDLLIPSLHPSDSVFDVDTVYRILVNFLQRIEEEDSEESSHCGYESESLKSPSHNAILKVGRLVEGYLAEIAPDPYLKLQKFMAIIKLLPDYAHVMEDGLYRAIDIYLKAHPSLTELECNKLCKLIDCEKLSQEASNHAAQNDRLPVQMVIRVLYFEQLRLKSSLSCNSCDDFFSQRMIGSRRVSIAAVSPRDNYASLRRENRELKLEISRMRVRLSELEKEQAFMKQGMRKHRLGGHGRAFFASLSRRIGQIGIFGPSGGHQQQNTRKAQGSDGKSRRRQWRSVSSIS